MLVIYRDGLPVRRQSPINEPGEERDCNGDSGDDESDSSCKRRHSRHITGTGVALLQVKTWRQAELEAITDLKHPPRMVLPPSEQTADSIRCCVYTIKNLGFRLRLKSQPKYEW